MNFFDTTDPNVLWGNILKCVSTILEIMCPFRRFRQREHITPWLNAEIYRAIRKRERLVRNFRYTRSNDSLIELRQQRNLVNSLIQRAKRDYILVTLNQNNRNPKRFWRIINNILNGPKTNDVTTVFVDPDTGDTIPPGQESNFLNAYFCNISQRLGFNDNFHMDPDIHVDMFNMYNEVDGVFDLSEDPILAPELEMFVADIDTSKSSCIQGISTLICKNIMTFFPKGISHIFRCSIESGIFPADWSKGYITVIPKTGKLSDPSNWRPITQTSIFAKVFEKLVHRRIMNYFMDYHILSPYQYGFCPQKSTQQSVFDFIKFVYSSLNNKKLFAGICLDVCKAFDCINHNILLYKLSKIGCTENTLLWVKGAVSQKSFPWRIY